jgi:hypothetical protein
MTKSMSPSPSTSAGKIPVEFDPVSYCRSVSNGTDACTTVLIAQVAQIVKINAFIMYKYELYALKSKV